MSSSALRTTLENVYGVLFREWGAQGWWPGEGPFEMMIGAILTQNTAWANVEKAITGLRRAKLLTVAGIHGVSHSLLVELIRPVGYFNLKARRLRNLTDYIYQRHEGSLKEMFSLETDVLRRELLSVNGIGPETADSILLYAGERPVFVVDAYTRRVLSRHNWIAGVETYEQVARLFVATLPEDAQLYNEFHALIVRLCKEHCGKNAKCDGCPLEGY